MDYNSSAPLQRQRNIYVCNICRVQNVGYVARNNHSRNHPDSLPTYTVMNDYNSLSNLPPQQASFPALSSPSIEHDGDIQMEDAAMSTGNIIRHTAFHNTGIIYLTADSSLLHYIGSFGESSVDGMDDDSRFEPIDLNIPYKTSGEFIDDEDPACVYDDNSNYQNMTKSELFSVHLADLVAEYGVPRECHRELVRLMNTMIRDHDAMIEGKPFLNTLYHLPFQLTCFIWNRGSRCSNNAWPGS